MNNVTLPDKARSKLRDLELARMTAEDAARAASNRLNGLGREADSELQRRLESERDRQTFRQGQLAALLSKVNQWLSRLPSGAALELAPADVELKRGETLSTAISNVRNEVKAVRQHLQAIKSAPLPKADQKKLAADYVEQLQREGKASVAVVSDNLKVSFKGDMFAAEDVLALLAWCAPDPLRAALEREIDSSPVRSDALPVAERIKRVAELEATLNEIERKEEALIERAHADGSDILRRPDQSPASVLGVVVAQAAAQAA